MFCIVVTAVFGAYFFFVSRLEAKEATELVCRHIDVMIQDSLTRSFISKSEIQRALADSTIGRRLSDIPLDSIEKSLTESGVISTAEAYTVYPDRLGIVVTQREPVLRIQADGNDVYCDRYAYILPVGGSRALHLPVVTGHLPVSLQLGATTDDDTAAWLESLLAMTEKIRNNAYWSEEIEQIDSDANGNLTLYLRKRPFHIIFGSTGDINDKFRKMSVFYKTILPTEEGAKYKEVNIKYKNQIICK